MAHTTTPEPAGYVLVDDPLADIPGLAELADSQDDRTHLDGWPLLPGEGLLGRTR